MKTISYYSHLRHSIILVSFIFLMVTLWQGASFSSSDPLLPKLFLQTFGTYYYLFFNGFFLYRLCYPYEKLDFIQIFCYSLLISTSINSLAFYFLNRALHIPMTLQTITLTATGILALILIGHLIHYKKLLL